MFLAFIYVAARALQLVVSVPIAHAYGTPHEVAPLWLRPPIHKHVPLIADQVLSTFGPANLVGKVLLLFQVVDHF